jgi:hypothetical protein
MSMKGHFRSPGRGRRGDSWRRFKKMLSRFSTGWLPPNPRHRSPWCGPRDVNGLSPSGATRRGWSDSSKLPSGFGAQWIGGPVFMPPSHPTGRSRRVSITVQEACSAARRHSFNDEEFVCKLSACPVAWRGFFGFTKEEHLEVHQIKYHNLGSPLPCPVSTCPDEDTLKSFLQLDDDHMQTAHMQPIGAV